MRKILITLLVLAFASTASALNINDPAPLFSLRDINNKYFHLSDYVNPSKKGLKGIILNFFASYCKPCKNELPVLNSLVDEFEKKGIKIVIVGYGEDFDKIQEMLSEIKVDKPIILGDVYSMVGKKYGVIGLPHTVIISADGKIKDIIRGELPEMEKNLRERVNRALK